MKQEKCADCDYPITFGELSYSLSQFKRPLCRSCQERERKKVYPKKLADFLNDKTASN